MCGGGRACPGRALLFEFRVQCVILKVLAVRALERVLDGMEAGGVPQSWWSEIVATLKPALQHEPMQAAALGALRKFVQLLDAETVARGLQQIFLMLLPCLERHVDEVVAIMAALVVKPHVEGKVSAALAEAFAEITFVPELDALSEVKNVLQQYVRKPGLKEQIRACTRTLDNECSAVRLMALKQLVRSLEVRSSHSHPARPPGGPTAARQPHPQPGSPPACHPHPALIPPSR